MAVINLTLMHNGSGVGGWSDAGTDYINSAHEILCVVLVVQRFGAGLAIERSWFDSRPGRYQVN